MIAFSKGVGTAREYTIKQTSRNPHQDGSTDCMLQSEKIKHGLSSTDSVWRQTVLRIKQRSES